MTELTKGQIEYLNSLGCVYTLTVMETREMIQLRKVEEQKWLVDYRKSLDFHIKAVQRAGEIIGVPIEQLESHDESKFSGEEFPYYAQQFFGDKGDPKGWYRAWLHHIHHNPHHWEHWIIPGRSVISEEADISDGILEMPHEHAAEMVADWLGSSYVYTGSWNMDEWLAKNYQTGKVILHYKTRKFVDGILLLIKKSDAFRNVEVKK